MPDHGHFGENVGTAADECRAFDRFRDLATFDQIGFAGGKHELSIRDVDLPSAERDRVEPFIHGFDDIFRLRLAGEHERIGHARQYDTLVALTPAVASHWNTHQARIQFVGDVAA